MIDTGIEEAEEEMGRPIELSQNQPQEREEEKQARGRSRPKA